MVHKDISWPVHESEMGELIHAKDWSKTSLGSIQEWPQTLLSTLNICLSSHFPSSICWGNDLLFFYNDAWKEIMGENNPSALGQSAGEIFEDVWPSNDSHLQQVLSTGKTQQLQDKRLCFNSEEYHCNLSLIPIPDTNNSVAGINIIMDVHDQKGTLADLKNAVTEAEQQKQLYEAIISGVPDLIYVFDLNYRFTFVNSALLEVWGRSREESIGKGMRELGYEDWHAEMHEREIDQVIATKEPVQGEVAFPHDKLGKRLYDYIFVPVFDDEGEVKAVAGITRDVTKRKQAEQKLRKNKNRLRAALEIETVGVLFWGEENFTITEVNDAFLDMSGYSREEALGKSWRELTPEEFYPTSKKAVAELKEKGNTEPYEKQYIRKNGSRWWGLFAPRRIDDNEVVEFVVDITERKKAEEQRERLLNRMKVEKERLSDIFKQAPSFMCILRGPDHIIERANDYYQELVGGRELIGKPVAEAIPEIKEQGLIELLDEVYESGESFRGKEMGVKLQRKPNQPAEKRFLDFVYQPFRDHEGSITGIFVQGVDLTERHHAKAKLESMNETLEERVAKRTKKLRSYQKQLRSLAAELNKAEEQERQRLASELHDKLGQILTVAKMRVDGLQNYELSKQISTDIEELKDIMDDALDYNRDLMSELKPPPALDKEDVSEVVYWTANKMEKHGLEIIIEDDNEPKPVEKEIRTIIHQSVRELLFNVVKHADIDTARLSMWRSNNQVRVAVEDEGKGFEPGEEKSIPVEEGFGLFNINERLEWHGGTFEIDSEPGKGTKATICAPLKEIEKSHVLEDDDVEGPLPPSVEEVVQAELWQKVEVLLVDDHDMVRRGLRQMIEEQDDMEIAAEAADGQEAIDLARKTSPDVIVMDVNMPVLDGIEATQKIKAEMPNIRIIGLSLHDREEVKQDMKSAGASDYLTKDEAFETLCATIRDEPTAAKK